MASACKEPAKKVTGDLYNGATKVTEDVYSASSSASSRVVEDVYGASSSASKRVVEDVYGASSSASKRIAEDTYDAGVYVLRHPIKSLALAFVLTSATEGGYEEYERNNDTTPSEIIISAVDKVATNTKTVTLRAIPTNGQLERAKLRYNIIASDTAQSGNYIQELSAISDTAELNSDTPQPEGP